MKKDKTNNHKNTNKLLLSLIVGLIYLILYFKLINDFFPNKSFVIGCYMMLILHFILLAWSLESMELDTKRYILTIVFTIIHISLGIYSYKLWGMERTVAMLEDQSWLNAMRGIGSLEIFFIIIAINMFWEIYKKNNS